MNRQHRYHLTTMWTGNKGTGTSGYREFERSHTIKIDDKPDILGSSDPAFRGDRTRHNPEDLLLASLSSCHMLWYLHLCSEAGIIVSDYTDRATGIMEETPEGGGKFIEAILHPRVTITNDSMKEKAIALHEKANELCFIANSVNFPVNHKPSVRLVSEEL